MAAPDLVGIFVLSDGLNVNGSELVAGITGAVGKQVAVTGGLAGDGADFQRNARRRRLRSAQTYWSRRSAFTVRRSASATAAPAAGTSLDRAVKSPDPAAMYCSNSTANRRSISTSVYLGDEEARGLPGSGLLFPLRIFDPERPDHDIVRTILAVDHEARSMTFAGDVPEGWTAQLMRGNFDRLAAGAASAARQAADGIGQTRTGDQLAILVSCIGRRLLMGQHTADELEATQRRIRTAHSTTRFLLVRRNLTASRVRRLRTSQPDNDRHDDRGDSGTRRCISSLPDSLQKRPTSSGEVDLQALLALVAEAYEQSDNDRHRTDRSIALMIKELEQLNRGLDQLVQERTAALREREAELQAQNLRVRRRAQEHGARPVHV